MTEAVVDRTSYEGSAGLAIVDGSNVARSPVPGSSGATMHSVESVVRCLRADGFRPVIIVDASLRHVVADKEGLETAIRNGSILQAPAGHSADAFLVQLANRNASHAKVILVTNDLLRGYSLDHRVRKVAFLLVDSETVLLDPVPRELKSIDRQLESLPSTSVIPTPGFEGQEHPRGLGEGFGRNDHRLAV